MIFIVTQHSLFDNFDVHVVVSVIANCHTKVHRHCIVFPLFQDVHSRNRTMWYVHFSSIHLRIVGEGHFKHYFLEK